MQTINLSQNDNLISEYYQTHKSKQNADENNEFGNQLLKTVQKRPKLFFNQNNMIKTSLTDYQIETLLRSSWLQNIIMNYFENHQNTIVKTSDIIKLVKNHMINKYIELKPSHITGNIATLVSQTKLIKISKEEYCTPNTNYHQLRLQENLNHLITFAQQQNHEEIIPDLKQALKKLNSSN